MFHIQNTYNLTAFLTSLCIALLPSIVQATTYIDNSITYSDNSGNYTAAPGNLAPEGGLGGIQSPGTATWDLSAISAGPATLSYEIVGYGSLDGWDTFCCTDIFTLYVNGNEAFSGSFNLGGRGSTYIFFNPGNGMATSNTTGYYGGGTLDITGEAVNLLAGNNTITFTYSSSEWPGPQGVGDEGWVVNSARVETADSAVPEPASISLLVSGILGFCVSRRKVLSRNS